MSSGEGRSAGGLGKLEIYIPADAEVRSVPLGRLPPSMLRKMKLPAPGGADTPLGVLIFPVVVRRKHAQNPSPLLAKQLRSVQHPLKMSFISASSDAHRVLENKTAAEVCAQSPDGRLARWDSVPLIPQDSIFIYQGHVYLSVKNGKRREKRESLPPSRHGASAATPDAQRKRRAPERPADQEPAESRPRDAKPQISPETLPRTGGGSTTGRPQSDQTGDPDHASGARLLDGGGGSGGSSGEPLGEAALNSPPQQADSDAMELQRMEKMAQLRARLQQRDAALNSLTTSSSSSSSR